MISKILELTKKEINNKVERCTYVEMDKNNVINMWNDIIGLGGLENMNFSLEEQVVGTWIDGKDLYMRVFKKELEKKSDIQTIPLDSMDIDIVNMTAVLKYKDIFTNPSLPIADRDIEKVHPIDAYHDGYVSIYQYKDHKSFFGTGNNIYISMDGKSLIESSSTYSDLKVIIIAYYTKD